MSKPRRQDPDKRAAKAKRRKVRREQEAAGVQMLPRKTRPTAQMDHGSNPRGAKHAREGERAINRERGSLMADPIGTSTMDERLARATHVNSMTVTVPTEDLRALLAERDALRAAARIVPTLDELRERRLPLDGQALARTNFESTEYDGNDHEGVVDLDQANLITSMVAAGGLSRLGGPFATHKVVVDVDLPVSVIASSTPGHFHLFIDKAMDWTTYLALLGALTAAGIVEPGYLSAAEQRGHTAVRLPWVRKGEPVPLPVLPECTHGADCQVHLTVNALHDFD